MNEIFPLEQAPEAYEQMMSGKTHFERSLQQDISLSPTERSQAFNLLSEISIE